MIIGKEEFAEELFNASLKYSMRTIDTNSTLVTFTNISDIDFNLQSVTESGTPKSIVVPGRSSVDIMVKNEDIHPSEYEVKNIYIRGYDHLKVTLFE